MQLQIIFLEKGLLPLHTLCMRACGDDKQLVWVDFLYVNGSLGETYMFFVVVFFFVKNS